MAKTENFEKLLTLLQELFQLDQADLDFGIYRIMNQKRDEVVRFLEKDLLPQVKEAFAQYRSADKAELQNELDRAIEQATSLGVDPDSVTKVKELRAKYESSSVDIVALENEVFSHLYSFFRRYYSEGDFISLRRYKEGVYAIPYEGEEVKLHWANHDQYYVKSSEYFRDYVFTMPSGKRVRVHLVAASSEQDNRKEAAGNERRFVIRNEDLISEENGELIIPFKYRVVDGGLKQNALTLQAIEQIDTELKSQIKASRWLESWNDELCRKDSAQGNEQCLLEQYVLGLTPHTRKLKFVLPTKRCVVFELQKAKRGTVSREELRLTYIDGSIKEVEDGVLHLSFAQVSGRVEQDEYNRASLVRITTALLSYACRTEWHRELTKLVPTKANPDRTLLEKHLTQYTARNTFDYFIHKDLDGFLRRELDFYIKNEVMHLDDIEHDTVPRVEQYLSKIKVIRKIAHKFIQFLEQLENFQKKLWLKKKFVVETNYCITLDQVPEELYPEIAANDAQRKEWVRLFAIDKDTGTLIHTAYSVPLSVQFLRSHTTLLVDTAFFGSQFKDRLISSIAELSTATDGLLVNGDNFHWTALAESSLSGKASCIYIDPPYNTGDGDFLYKDSYQHSSWAAMIADRASQGRRLLRQSASMLVSIGREEHHRLVQILDGVFGEANRLAEFVWEKGRKNDALHLSLNHEHILLYGRDLVSLKACFPSWREQKAGVPEVKRLFAQLRNRLGDQYEEIKYELLKYIVTKLDPAVARSILLFSKLDEGGPFRDDTDLSWPGGGGPRYDVINPANGLPVEIPQRGWVCVQDTMREWLASGRVQFDADDPTRLYSKRYLFEYDEQVKGSTIYKHSKSATRQLRDTLGAKVFDNPKDPEMLADLISYVAPCGGLVIDYFAGSGTTAHSVVMMNRRTEAPRYTYALVDSAAFFDTILRTRVARIVYSSEWKAGQPMVVDGTGHFLKYIRLESYEDALNNLELIRTEQQASLLSEGEMLHEQYVLSYMLEMESRGSQSLLNVTSFRNPDQYKLRVDRDGETQLVNVDLVETFNWLLGLTVKHIDVIPLKKDQAGVRVVQGTNPSGEKVLVLWRNLDETDNDALDVWFKKQKYNTKDQEYDLIYVNGDNNLENLRRGDQTWKVRLIEEEFNRLMFDTEDV